ncbi:hypothetical protein Neosp_010400 [[Neocosmospora] mangrovei]
MCRIGPNKLSFSSVESYKDIYGHSTKWKKPFLKSTWYANDDRGPPSILSARDPVDHGRQRQSLSHAFSVNSLRDQEVVVHNINMPEAFKWLTFDIIGDLAFVRLVGWIVAKGAPDDLVLPFIFVKDAANNHIRHQKLTAEKVAKCMEQKDSLARAEVFHHILKKGDFTQQGLESQASTLIIARSETTAAFLPGATYFLLKTPDYVSKLQQEVRGAFVSITEITGDSTKALPYLRGVIVEALRLYPPHRGVVAEHYVPVGTMVSTDHWTTMHDPKYWHESDSFHPERWVLAIPRKLLSPFRLAQEHASAPT